MSGATAARRARIRAGVTGVSVIRATIDRVNILPATKRAMAEALTALVPDLVITDFVALPGLPCPQKSRVEGDRRCAMNPLVAGKEECGGQGRSLPAACLREPSA